MEWGFLAIGGFLLGTFLYTGYYTVRYEPEVRYGYFVLGVGIVTSLVVNTWVDFAYSISNAYRTATLVAYTFIALGLVLVIRARRRGH